MKEEIEHKIGYHFKDPSLLELAFTHRSFWNENKESCQAHNERLEFLGDSVLGLLVSEYLYKRLPDADEGTCSKMRSQIVSADACSGRIQTTGLEHYLLLGRGEKLNKGRGRDSILADLFEALLGAIYLDGGYEKAKKFFFTHFLGDLEHQIERPGRNWKAELQDFSQKSFQQTPTYEVLEEYGPAHQKEFRVAVIIDGKQVGEGTGLSKKEAQVEAARKALEKLDK